MTYKTVQKLKDGDFKGLTLIQGNTFEKMLEVVKKDYAILVVLQIMKHSFMLRYSFVRTSEERIPSSEGKKGTPAKVAFNL